MAIIRKRAGRVPSPKALSARLPKAPHAERRAIPRSPVHALQTSIEACWFATPAAGLATPKVLGLDSVVAIVLLGMLAWTPIAGAAFFLNG